MPLQKLLQLLSILKSNLFIAFSFAFVLLSYGTVFKTNLIATHACDTEKRNRALMGLFHILWEYFIYANHVPAPCLFNICKEEMMTLQEPSTHNVLGH